jgi:Mor family transcriptional regulator
MSTIKLSIEKVRNIRKLYSTGNWTHEMLSKRYKCSRGHVTKIINQMRWDESKYPQLKNETQEDT